MSFVPSFVRRFGLACVLLPPAFGASLLVSGTLSAQSFKPGDLAPAPPRIEQPDSLEARTRGLNEIFDDYWQNRLKHSPEMASAVGDHRYDDQLSDYSPQAYDETLARGEEFIERLGAIDTSGMSAQEKLRKGQLVDRLVDQQESAACKPWQTPLTESYGIQVELPMLAQTIGFHSAEDYDQYVARLNQIPPVFMQIGTDLMLGQQAGRSEPQSILEKVLAQVQTMASTKPEETPFASPVQHFPAGIPPRQQAEIRGRVLTAIRTQVQPAYARFAKFLTAEYIPQIQQQPNSANVAGNACSVADNAQTFDDGRMEILELRQSAEKALGEKFNLSAFRDAVKASSLMPPDDVQKHMEQWIAQQQKSAMK